MNGYNLFDAFIASKILNHAEKRASFDIIKGVQVITTSSSQSVQQMLALRVSVETINEIKALLLEPLRIGEVTYSLNEWLNGGIVESSSNAVTVAQYAGFQGAVISSGIEELLFLLENLRSYLKLLNIHVQYVEQIETLEKEDLSSYNDMGFFVRNYTQDELNAKRALNQACHVLEVIWTECIQTNGNFYVNIPLSCISGGPTGFEQSANESAEIVKKIARSLKTISTQKAMKFWDIQEEPTEESEITPEIEIINNPRHLKALMITTINNVNKILVRVLPYIIGIEGIKQVGREHHTFVNILKKWTNQSTPPNAWNQNQKKIIESIKAVGKILDEWFVTNIRQESSSIERVMPLVSPRSNRSIQPVESHSTTTTLIAEASHPHFKSIFSRFSRKKPIKAKSFGLPDDFIQWDDVKKLKAVKAPLTEEELTTYFHIIEYIQSLQGKRWESLKERINERLSEAKAQEYTLIVPQNI